jgi:transcriptional regulator of acetoin/glycerol metabolism
LQDAERQTLLDALEKHNWNKVETAKALGLHRTTLWRKMKHYGIV